MTLLAALALHALSCQKGADTPIRSAFDHRGQPHCTGRFNYLLPAFLRSGGGQRSLYRVEVDAVAWPPGLGAPEAWQQRLAETLAHPAASGTTAQAPRELELRGVGPAAWMQLFASRPDLATLVAMKPLPTAKASLFLRVEASVGREALVHDVVSEVAASYAPASPQGFCASPGAFVIAPSHNERALESFSAPGLELSIQTETVDEPDDGSSTDITPPPGVRRLSKRPRRVGGFDGVEERMRIAEPGEPPQLSYIWIFPGRSADGAAPRIHLSAAGDESRAATLDAAWKMLLDSWCPRPTGLR